MQATQLTEPRRFESGEKPPRALDRKPMKTPAGASDGERPESARSPDELATQIGWQAVRDVHQATTEVRVVDGRRGIIPTVLADESARRGDQRSLEWGGRRCGA